MAMFQLFKDGGFFRPDARMVDEVECAASVLLAIAFAHLLHASNVSWAAFSGYMVMRGHAADTLHRGAMRVAGTVAGGLLALIAVPWISSNVWPQAGVLALVGAAGLYGALTAKHSYAWLFFGLTFAMICCDKIERPDDSLSDFVRWRLLETGAGTLACVLVSLISTTTARRYWPSARVAPGATLGWRADAFRHGVQGGVALAALALLAARYPIPDLSQGAVSIMAVMLVPITAVSVTASGPVRLKTFERFVGCGAGAALGAGILLGSGGHAAILILGAVAGVMLGRHIENGDNSHRYAGTQFTLAILIMLVPDHYDSITLEPGLDRLLSIVVGMAVLEPVLLIWHLLSPCRPATTHDGEDHELGGV